MSIILNKDVSFRYTLALYTLARAGKIMCDVLMEKGMIPDNKFTEYVFPIILGGLMSLLFVIVFHMDHDIWPKSKY